MLSNSYRLSSSTLVRRAHTLGVDHTCLECGIKVGTTSTLQIHELTTTALVVCSTILWINLDVVFCTCVCTGALTTVHFARLGGRIPIVARVAGLLNELSSTTKKVVQATVGIFLDFTVGTAVRRQRTINMPEHKAYKEH